MLKEHKRVVLNTDVPASGLKAGDVGTIVHVHNAGRAYEVEFVSLDGDTSFVVTVEANSLRPVHKLEMPHARQLAYA
ncbi:MAG: DUF4926 domain-containing protein [Kiritimatiellia bacterium]|jgi:hypothetical protein